MTATPYISSHSGTAFPRLWPAFAVLTVLWLVSLPLACLPGPVSLSAEQVFHALAAQLGLVQEPQDASLMLVVGQIRLARVCLAALCGGALAVAGVALQGVLRNPLADPFTLGISAGAACGASVAIALGGVLAATLSAPLAALRLPLPGPAALVPPAALAGALLALAGALWLGRGDGGFRRESVILAGIAVAAFLGALVALIKALNEESVTSIVFWIMGSFQGRGWDSLPLLLLTLVPGLLAVGMGWRALDVLALGDEQAAQLGLHVGRARLWLLAGASCMTAGCVAVAGVIGFVGLVVPHVLRLVLGCGHGPLLAGAFFGGGVLLVWADVLARCVLDGGQELPVGVVTALVGGPFFALLVRRRT
ncbi:MULTISPECIES: FecCD family ABC transporter permease [Desulfovibrio]|nr:MULTISPECIES: iron ABC transporter permease [Desulfovibrio]ATD82796.1 iron ABC transporter permease [Desulfovibrio sp. G11]MDY0203877.1 iron ABC transporter permease [Desulfovibrio desulfuricans]